MVHITVNRIKKTPPAVLEQKNKMFANIWTPLELDSYKRKCNLGCIVSSLNVQWYLCFGFMFLAFLYMFSYVLYKKARKLTFFFKAS